MTDPDFRYYLVTDRNVIPGPGLLYAIEEACSNGIKAIQLREKDLPARELYKLASRLQEIVTRYGAKLFINGRADIAIAIGTTGVHCPESGPGPDDVKQLDNSLWVGASVHSTEVARRAEIEGADFIVFGPVYHTASKAAYGEPRGIACLRDVVNAVSRPVYAVGGVTPDRAHECLAAGAAGVAGISDILGAESVASRVATWREILGEL